MNCRLSAESAQVGVQTRAAFDSDLRSAILGGNTAAKYLLGELCENLFRHNFSSAIRVS